TPRVSFCATATPAAATTPTTTLRIKSFFIARSLRKCRPWAVPLSLRVHVVDDVLVLRVDERALELHRRRQLVVLRREDLLDEPELLDRLHPGELLVDALDLAPDEVLHVLRATQRGEVRERDVSLLGELGHRLVVDHDEAGEEPAPVADDHGVGDVRRELELVLDLRGRDVLAARGDDDVLHAVGDLHEAARVDAADVAGVRPPVADALRRLLGLAVVAEEDVRAPEEDLALGRDAHL